jgi:hypothetical protein
LISNSAFSTLRNDLQPSYLLSLTWKLDTHPPPFWLYLRMIQVPAVEAKSIESRKLTAVSKARMPANNGSVSPHLEDHINVPGRKVISITDKDKVTSRPVFYRPKVGG